MCEACSTDAMEWHNAVIPGYTLMYAQKSGTQMKSGQWALAQGGDPILIWDKKPEMDPDFHLDPNEKDESKFASFDSIEFKLFYTAFENIQKNVKCEPQIGYKLISAAELVGFDLTKEKNGCFASWLCHKLGEYLIDHPEPDEMA